MEVAVYPLLTNPSILAGGLLRTLGQLAPVVVPFFSVKVARDYCIPLLAAVPGALVVVCVLCLRRLAGARPAGGSPFESPEPAPVPGPAVDRLLDPPPRLGGEREEAAL
ncbi:MAG: hypothetical protein ACRDV4_10525 [Acidimicrobiales bacterium]